MKENQNTLIKNNGANEKENKTKKNHKIMNEIIGVLIKNNLTHSESIDLLDGVRRHIGVQTITSDCLYK